MKSASRLLVLIFNRFYQENNFKLTTVNLSALLSRALKNKLFNISSCSRSTIIVTVILKKRHTEVPYKWTFCK